jgi:ribosomal protein L24E
VTLIRPDGKVIYDNIYKNYSSFSNHRNPRRYWRL